MASITAFAAEPQVIPLWTNGAPGFESRRDEPEKIVGTSVCNINNPSLTVFLPPKEKANGTGVLIFPGGGFRQLVVEGEGAEPAQYLNNLGIAAFVLKYRLPRETNSPYSLGIHPRQDAQRAMRLVRSKAADWGLATNRIGILGFSAGGEVAALLAYSPTAGDPSAPDPIERMNCRADFQMVIYPGPLGIPEHIPADAPPAFFVVANDDTNHVGAVIEQVTKYHEAKLPVEAHIYAKGGHGFKMGNRSDLASIKNWPNVMTDWLAENHLISRMETIK